MSLVSCYEKLAKMNCDLDSYEVVAEVERYRQFWKPEEVRVVLLAESHVRTRERDFDNPPWSYGLDSIYEGKFVRFVYCLGYGEKDLVRIPSNKGTWQFWLLLSSCLNNPSDRVPFSSVLRKTTRDFHSRVRNKIRLLEKLKQSGIWLLDASIVGVNDAKDPIRTRIILECWKNYTRPVLESLHATLKHIIVVGRGVERTLGDDVGRLCANHSVVPQPQAREPGGYSRYYKEIFDTCHEFHRQGSGFISAS